MKPQKGFRPAILHPASLITLLLLIFSLIALVEYACRALPSTDHDVFQELRRRDPEPILVGHHNVVEKSVTKTIIVTTSIPLTTQVQMVQQQLGRAAAPQEEVISSDDVLNFETTSTSSFTSPWTTSTKSFRRTTSISFSSTRTFATANPSAYLQPEKTPEPGAPNREAYLQAENGHIKTTGKYFVGAYLPTILAVFFALPWLVLYRTVVSLEPFHRLSASGGASAETSLTESFLSLWSAFQALKNGQWTVVLSAMLMFSSILITPIAPDTVSIQTVGQCDHTTKGCGGLIRVLLPAARVIQAILGVMALLTVILIALERRKRMKILFDPRSIAGLASIWLDPAVQQDIRMPESVGSKSALEAALNGSTYKLDFTTRYDGAHLISLLKTRGQQTAAPQHPDKHDYSSLDYTQTVRLAPRYRLLASILFVFLVALEALILAYHETGGDTGFENFMSGQGFGVRFLFTSFGILVSRYWGWVFQDISLLVPYSSLAEGNALARESILLIPPSHPLFGLGSSLSARHFVFTVVTIAALLSEILTVTLATIPFSSANHWLAYEISNWISVGIIAMMLLALALLFFYREPVLPIKPDSIAAQLMYLADSSLPGKFVGMSGCDTRTMRKRVEGLEMRYRLRPAKDVPGMLVVDVEEAALRMT